MNWLLSLLGDRTLGGVRNPAWANFRKTYIKNKCEVCGATRGLTIHHRLPFHLFPEKELDINNIITLCDWKANNCHWRFGHLFQSWSSYNEKVEEVATIFRQQRNKVI